MKRAAASIALLWGLSACIGPFAAGPVGGVTLGAMVALGAPDFFLVMKRSSGVG